MSDQNQPDFELRAKARQAQRIDRKKLFLLATVLSSALILMIAWSFMGTKRSYIVSKDQTVTKQKSRPEGIDKLPSSYRGFRQNTETLETKRRRLRIKRQQVSKLTLKARASQLLFAIKPTHTDTSTSTNTNSGTLSDTLTTLSRNLKQRGNNAGQVAGVPTSVDKDQNMQYRKITFLSASGASQTRNIHGLQKPSSPYIVSAGTVISASLITGLNSDLPGQVIAQVTSHVYDSPTGKHLLIPQGSKLIGKYDSAVAFAQKRALVVWHRLILPNGNSLVIDNLPATDASGFAGLKDKVDHHRWALIKGVALATILNVGTSLNFGQRDNSAGLAVLQATQGNVGRASDSIVTRNLNIQPTLRVRPGWPLRVIVNKDLILEPY